MSKEEHAPKRRRGLQSPQQELGTDHQVLKEQSPVKKEELELVHNSSLNEGSREVVTTEQHRLEDNARPFQTAELVKVIPLDEENDTKMVGASLVSERNGAYTQRELYFQEQEDNGTFKFIYLHNDGQTQHSIWLIALKSIFSRQLPNMPKEYITRLVLDRRHRSVAVIRSDGTVVGGITYRPFHSQGFGEIAFCAVSASDQVKGFGSRLMSYTKEYAKEKDCLSHFLTYADNNAVTFFAKQGFTAEVTLDRDRWVGYIKDYDGGTLMESVLHTELPYTKIPQMIQAQKAALDAQLRSLCKAHVVYPVLKHFDTLDFAPLHPSEIPGVSEAGWTEDSKEQPTYRILLDGEECEPSVEAIARLAHGAVAALRAHEDSPAFCYPVKAEEVPDYYDIIKDPMDLSKIKKRIESKKFYVTLEIFMADVRRIFKNAHLYNAADTYWHKAATRLETFFEQYMTTHLVVLNAITQHS